jgi:hypothetical protein
MAYLMIVLTWGSGGFGLGSPEAISDPISQLALHERPGPQVFIVESNRHAIRTKLHDFEAENCLNIYI